MLFKLLFVHWVLGCVRLYVTPLKRKSQFLIALWVPWTPLVFLARYFGGSSLWCSSQGLGCLMWDTNPLFLQKKCWIGEIPPLLWVTMSGVGIWLRPCLCLSYPSRCGPFNLCCEEVVHVGFRSFFFSFNTCLLTISHEIGTEGNKSMNRTNRSNYLFETHTHKELQNNSTKVCVRSCWNKEKGVRCLAWLSGRKFQRKDI